MVKYAINISDLIGVPVATYLLSQDVVPDRIIVNAEKGQIDGSAILLQCDEHRARAIVEVIRMNCKKHQLRCYMAQQSEWKRI